MAPVFAVFNRWGRRSKQVSSDRPACNGSPSSRDFSLLLAGTLALTLVFSSSRRRLSEGVVVFTSCSLGRSVAGRGLHVSAYSFVLLFLSCFSRPTTWAVSHLVQSRGSSFEDGSAGSPCRLIAALCVYACPCIHSPSSLLLFVCCNTCTSHIQSGASSFEQRLRVVRLCRSVLAFTLVESFGLSTPLSCPSG